MVKKVTTVVMLTVISHSFGMQRFASPAPMHTQDAKSQGMLRVLTGPMACRKTDELMALIETWRIGKSNVLVCKHSFDTRSATSLSTRRGRANPIVAYPIDDPQEILRLAVGEAAKYVAIDEVQFFQAKPMALVIKTLRRMGIFVAASGLDLDFKGDPFGTLNPDGSLVAEPLCMPTLLSMAEEVVKYQAICSVCSQWNATMTQRLVAGKPAHKNDPLVIIDDGTHPVVYEPRCAGCHQLLE